MKRHLVLAYGIACHALFLGVFAALLAFVGNWFLPRTIDRGSTVSLPLALAIDSLLIAGFGLQHSAMARPAFKRWWTKFVPPAIERSTYVLISAIVTALLMILWQPIGIIVWEAPAGIMRNVLYALFFAGWLLVPAVSLLINHFDLFGTRQVWLYWRGRPYESLAFRTPGMYAWVRHPLYIGWAIAFWAAPTMTVGHLLFAAGMTLYMLIAVQFEERDLVAHYGEEYSTYQQRVGMFVPKTARTSKANEPLHAVKTTR